MTAADTTEHEATTMKDKDREARPDEIGGTGAKGGREVLKPDQQEPTGVEPDSIVDEKLRRSKRRTQGGLEPNTIVRN
jgi:hypothetical protein